MRDLKKRTKDSAIRVIRLYRALPKACILNKKIRINSYSNSYSYYSVTYGDEIGDTGLRIPLSTENLLC